MTAGGIRGGRRGSGLMLALGTALFLVLAGCTARVHPPKTVQDPVQIWFLANGTHPSVVLPTGEGTVVQFDYGEWEWYALNQQNIFKAPIIFLYPTAGALGRREIALPPRMSLERLGQALMAEHIWTFHVERDKHMQLLQQLETIYQAGRASEHYDPIIDTWFVVYPRPYHALHTCGHAMSEWLKVLGCKVSGTMWALNWKVQETTQQIDGVP